MLLLRGLPGTGKSRVVAEILLQSAARNQRVLLMGYSPAAIDGVLDAVSGRQEIYALRCLGSEESYEALAPSIRALTLAGRRQNWNSEALPGAMAAASARNEQYLRLRQNEVVWPRLLDLGAEFISLESRRATVVSARVRLRPEIESLAAAIESNHPSGPQDQFWADFAAFLMSSRGDQQKIEKLVTACQRELQLEQKELKFWEARRNELRELVRIRKEKKWWRWSWWKAVFHFGLGPELTKLEDQVAEGEQLAGRLEKELVQRIAEQERARKSFETGRNERIGAELMQREAQLAGEENALDQAQQDLEEQWQSTVAQLDPLGPQPLARTPFAVRTTQAALLDQLAEVKKAADFHGQLAAKLRGIDPDSIRFGSYANVVATTVRAFCGGSLSALDVGSTPFDLLILQEADQASVEDIQKIAPRAPRWILVGEPPWERKNGQALSTDQRSAASVEGGRWRVKKHSGVPPSTLHPSPSTHHPPPSRPTYFQSMWDLLRFDWKRRPCSWTVQGRGLCCRLQEISSEERHWLETERVADCPEIELRILARPRTTSALAEIVFPANYSISQVKNYVYRELQELAVAPAGHLLSWSDEADQVVLGVEDAPTQELTACTLEQGITEYVTLVTELTPQGHSMRQWRTSSLRFARAQGWDRARAEAWIGRYLGIRDPGRTIHLAVSYRMEPDLAAVVSNLLFAATYRCPSERLQPNGRNHGSGEGDPSIEFVPIPPLARPPAGKSKNSSGRPSRGSPTTASVLPSAGAGLELNLADPRHCERLPRELHPTGLHVGFVNMGEAQAVVRALEALPAEPSIAGAAGTVATPPREQRIAVMALYPGQVELIRRLVELSPRLKKCCPNLEFGLPTAFRERECPTVFLSLTRSHPHRAVSFGEGPHLLALALTRARSKLVIFGDPGSLSRRSQWTGHVDHLDESAAEREHEVVARLVEYLRGQGSHAHAFHLHEGLAS
jgi:hypothetical protein